LFLCYETVFGGNKEDAVDSVLVEGGDAGCFVLLVDAAEM
jgi:hypothetical protein